MKRWAIAACEWAILRTLSNRTTKPFAEIPSLPFCAPNARRLWRKSNRPGKRKVVEIEGDNGSVSTLLRFRQWGGGNSARGKNLHRTKFAESMIFFEKHVFFACNLYYIHNIACRMNQPLARIRKELWTAYRQMGRVLRRLQRLQNMTPGSLYLLRRRCGKTGCRCARGQLHATWVVTRSEGGRIRLYSVRDEERSRVRQWTGQYRLYQRGRARLAKLTAGLLIRLDELAEAQGKVWPTVNRKDSRP
jgi:hypothetical protein